MTKIISRGIPQHIIRGTQSFQLVAMIEGAAANAQFINNLQVLGQQRRQLAELSQKIDALPPMALPEQRTALETERNQLDARVTANLQFMTKHYGYSVTRDYMLSPLQSALLLKGMDDKGQPIEDQAKATLVAELRTSEAYDELQALRNRVGELAADPAKADELEAAKTKLKDEFDFDVNKHYILEVRKAALYATVVD
jgi:hypothetical protein